MERANIFTPLTEELLGRIKDEAYRVLEEIGVFFEFEEAFGMLENYGCSIDAEKRKLYIPRKVILKALESAPDSITIYDRNGNLSAKLEGTNVHYDPGSAAINILDYDLASQRKPDADDLVTLAKLVNKLENFALQSTSLVPGKVPDEISDSIRLYIALKYSPKPVITGTFRRESFKVMHELLKIVRGSEEALREKPLSIFDCCPSPPLMWSALTAAAVIDCARAGIPSEFVSMPLMGATAPVTYTGALVQHTAEDLSGVVLAQAAKAGAPVIYGGSPSVFDMRQGTTPMGAIETMLFDAAYAQIGRSFRLPTHAYMGLSDSRNVDYQGGLESGMGAVLAAAAGVNMVSGAGMMDFESCQSFEKLVLDNEICGMALHLRKGIQPLTESLGYEQISQFADSGDFLKSTETRRLYRQQQYFPSTVIERSAGGMESGSDAYQRAHEAVLRLTSGEADMLGEDKLRQVESVMLKEAVKFGLSKLKV